MAKTWRTALGRLRDRALRHWPIKVTALVLAAILWAAVAIREPTTQFVPARLEVEAPPGRVVTGDLPPVRVRYAGTARDLFKLYAEPPVIRKSLPDSITGAEYVLELTAADVSGVEHANVKAQLVEPRTVTIRLDHVAQRTVPVVARVSVAPDSGYQIFGGVVIAPREVTVRGPGGFLGAIDSVLTTPLDLTDLRGPVRRQLALDTGGLGPVHLVPASVWVSVDVGTVSERVLMGVPVVVRSERPGHWTSEPLAVTVTVRGRSARLAALTRDSILVHAVVTGVPLEATVHLDVVPPSGVAAWATPDSVLVRRAIGG